MQLPQNATANIAAYGQPFLRHDAARLLYSLHWHIPYDALPGIAADYGRYRFPPALQRAFETWFLPLYSWHAKSSITAGQLPNLLRHFHRARRAARRRLPTRHGTPGAPRSPGGTPTRSARRPLSPVLLLIWDERGGVQRGEEAAPPRVALLARAWLPARDERIARLEHGIMHTVDALPGSIEQRVRFLDGLADLGMLLSESGRGSGDGLPHTRRTPCHAAESAEAAEPFPVSSGRSRWASSNRARSARRTAVNAASAAAASSMYITTIW